MRVAISDFSSLVVHCVAFGEDGASDFVLLGFDVERKPETGLAVVVDAKAAQEPVRWFWRRRDDVADVSVETQSTRHYPPHKERKRIKGGETPPKSDVGTRARAHFFRKPLSLRPLATRLVSRTHSRARAKQSFARVRVSSCPSLPARASFSRGPPAFFSVKNLFLLRRKLCERGGKTKAKKKDALLSRVGRSLGTRRRVTRTKKGEEEEGSNAPVLDRLKEERSSRGDGRGHVFFSSSFCCVRVGCVKSLFFSFEGKRKSEATTKKGFKVSSISHLNIDGGSSKERRLCLVPLPAQNVTPSKDPEWPERGKEEEEEEEEEESAS